MTPTAADAIRTYILAKDGNRPHLIAAAFTPEAVVEITVRGGAIAFPPRQQGHAEIADAVVRRFALGFENVYTFCLAEPPAEDAATFACDWLVGMTERAGGAVRVGCGRYDWVFGTARRVERLTIAIDRMETLPAAADGDVMDWLAALPYPWCPPSVAVTAAPALPALAPVLDRIAGRTA